ncbi:hypothetical protein BKA70DRAFT_1243973 [Coprinopsis sp. MPI-PUGE-AT-0042]|nr:hypothetical protein BKA70DRAFT_1243973 [Coprinopsis sp. MPI-PUGE-AT-0042]
MENLYLPVNHIPVYRAPPHAYTGLAFTIMGGEVKVTRTVRVERNGEVEYYELWSPNATTHQYYPGVMLGPISARDRFSFVDGRSGPSDWSLHPQHFDPKRPWLPFCPRLPSTIPHWRGVDPEMVPLPMVATITQSLVTFHAEYREALQEREKYLRLRVQELRARVVLHDPLAPLLRDQLAYPRQHHIAQLFDKPLAVDAVYYFSSIQRGLREMVAFIDMMQFWNLRKDIQERRAVVDCSQFPSSTAQMLEGRMGCWLNGADELDAKWLLATGVCPLYIIHRYHDYLNPSLPAQQLRQTSAVFTSFMDGTSVAEATATKYYEFLYRTSPPIYRVPEQRHFPPWNTKLAATVSSQCRSAPWAGHLRLPTPRTAHSTCGSSNTSWSWSWSSSTSWVPSSNISWEPSPSSWTANSPNPYTTSWGLPSSSQPDGIWGSSSPPRQSFVPAPPLPAAEAKRQRLVEGEDGVSYWVPPPVHGGPESRKVGGKNKSKTSWESYRQGGIEDLDFHDGRVVEVDQLVMLLEGSRKRKQEQRGSMGTSWSHLEHDDEEIEIRHPQYYPRQCYDRVGGRRLYFEDCVPFDTRVHFDTQIFGFPLPQNLKFYYVDNGYAKGRCTSRWAYFDARPLPGHEGRELEPDACRPKPNGSALASKTALVPPLPTPEPTLLQQAVVNLDLAENIPPLAVDNVDQGNDVTVLPLIEASTRQEAVKSLDEAPVISKQAVDSLQKNASVTRLDSSWEGDDELDWGEDEGQEMDNPPSAAALCQDTDLMVVDKPGTCTEQTETSVQVTTPLDTNADPDAMVVDIPVEQVAPVHIIAPAIGCDVLECLLDGGSAEGVGSSNLSETDMVTDHMASEVPPPACEPSLPIMAEVAHHQASIHQDSETDFGEQEDGEIKESIEDSPAQGACPPGPPMTPRAFGGLGPRNSDFVYADAGVATCSALVSILHSLGGQGPRSILSVVRDHLPSALGGCNGFAIRFGTIFDSVRFSVCFLGRDGRLSTVKQCRFITAQEAAKVLADTSIADQWHASSSSSQLPLLSRLSSPRVVPGEKKKGGIRDKLVRRFERPFWDIANDLKPHEYSQCDADEIAYIVKKRLELQSRTQSNQPAST